MAGGIYRHSWSYSSGRPLTAPDQKYEIDGTTCYYYTERNSYKTPASHRLDLSAKYTKVGKRLTSVWVFGIYNVYSHYSPFIIYFEDDSTKTVWTRAVQRSLFGIVPSISYFNQVLIMKKTVFVFSAFIVFSIV